MKTETPNLNGKDKMKNPPILATQTQIRGSFSERYPMVQNRHSERIRMGQAYYFQGQPYTVGLMNECRARLDPAFRIPRTITSRLHDTQRTIFTTPPSVSISNSAELIPATL